MGTSAWRGRRQRDVDDQVARLQNGLTLRRVSGKQMKIANGNAAFAFVLLNVNGRFERSQCHVHVGRIGGDAMFARAQNGEAPVYSRDRVDTRSGVTFVATRGGL